MQWLKDAIVTYLENRPGQKPDSITICCYFKLPVDQTYAALKALEDDGRVIRHNGILGGWNGNHYYALPKEVMRTDSV